MNILPLAVLLKLPARCSIDSNQSLKYCRKTFRNQENHGSSTDVKGARDGFRLYSCDLQSLKFKISKNVSIKEQNFAVSCDSGAPYVDNMLLTEELNTWAANLTFIEEYGVNFICSYERCGSKCNPHYLSS